MDNNTFNNMQPTQPVSPAPQPVPPVQPQPMQPAQPQPLQPAQPMQPMQPIQPMQPAQPIQSQPVKSPISVSIKSIILTAVNAFGVICFFLPWAATKRQSFNAAEIGADYRYMGYAILILLVISATIAGTRIMGKLSLIPKICISALSGIAALLAIILIIIIFNEFKGYASAGVGLWLCLITSVVTAALAWIPIKNE